MLIKLTWNQLLTLEDLLVDLRDAQRNCKEGLLVLDAESKVKWNTIGIEIRLPEEVKDGQAK